MHGGCRSDRHRGLLVVGRCLIDVVDDQHVDRNVFHFCQFEAELLFERGEKCWTGFTSFGSYGGYRRA